MKFNSASTTGLFLCFLALFYGVFSNGGLGSIQSLIDPASAIVTFGGAFFAAMMTSDSFGEFVDGIKSFGDIFHIMNVSCEEVTEGIINLSDIARREGILALEQHSSDIDYDFFNVGLSMVIDGTSDELVRDIMESRMLHTDERNKNHIGFWRDLGGYGPAWGMIGTLLGLINMMRSMGGDVSAVGEGMSLALITTLYGSILANWICIPVARRLEKSNAMEMLMMELCTEGVLSIQAGENPHVIQKKLQSITDITYEKEE